MRLIIWILSQWRSYVHKAVSSTEKYVSVVIESAGYLFANHSILYILKNETYCGDKFLQKQPPRDFLTKKPDKRQQYESFYLVGS